MPRSELNAGVISSQPPNYIIVSAHRMRVRAFVTQLLRGAAYSSGKLGMTSINVWHWLHADRSCPKISA